MVDYTYWTWLFYYSLMYKRMVIFMTSCSCFEFQYRYHPYHRRKLKDLLQLYILLSFDFFRFNLHNCNYKETIKIFQIKCKWWIFLKLRLARILSAHIHIIVYVCWCFDILCQTQSTTKKCKKIIRRQFITIVGFPILSVPS